MFMKTKLRGHDMENRLAVFCFLFFGFFVCPKRFRILYSRRHWTCEARNIAFTWFRTFGAFSGVPHIRVNCLYKRNHRGTMLGIPPCNVPCTAEIRSRPPLKSSENMDFWSPMLSAAWVQARSFACVLKRFVKFGYFDICFTVHSFSGSFCSWLVSIELLRFYIMLLICVINYEHQ